MKKVFLCIFAAILLTSCTVSQEETNVSVETSVASDEGALSVIVSDDESGAESVSEESTEEPKEEWTETKTSGNKTDTKEYRNWGKEYTHTVTYYSDEGIAIDTTVREYVNDILRLEKIYQYDAQGTEVFVATTECDESGNPTHFESVKQMDAFQIWREHGYSNGEAEPTTIRYQTNPGNVLAEGITDSYFEDDVVCTETTVSVFSETGELDHQEYSKLIAKSSYWEYRDAFGEPLFRLIEEPNNLSFFLFGESGGIITVEGVSYTFAKTDGTFFLTATVGETGLQVDAHYEGSEDAIAHADNLLKLSAEYLDKFFLYNSRG